MSDAELNLIGLLTYGVVGGLLVGFIIGSIYGFGPAIYFMAVSLPDEGLLFIGTLLTLLGIIALALLALMS